MEPLLAVLLLSLVGLITLVSSSPSTDPTLLWPPEDYFVFVLDTDTGVFDTAYTNVTVNGFGGIDAITGGVFGSGWEGSIVLSLGDTRQTISVRRTGGWTPLTNYGVIGEPANTGAYLILVEVGNFGAGFDDFPIPRFTTGSLTSAVTRTNLSAEVRARLALDLPIIAARNAAARYNAVPQWRTSGSLSSGIDISDPLWSPELAMDGDHHVGTRPMLHTGVTVDFMIMDLQGLEFDVAIIVGNFGQLGGVSRSVQLQVADDPSFSTNLETIATWSSNLTRRLVSVTLGVDTPGVVIGASYSGVRYARVRVSYDGGPLHPEVREVMLFRRRALPHRPDVPWDEEQTETRVDALDTIGGDEHGSSRYAGRRVLNGSWLADDDDYEALFRGWWADSGYGTEPWAWIPRPLTAVRRAFIMQPQQNPPSLSIEQFENPGLRRVRIAALEKGPFVAHEEAA